MFHKIRKRRASAAAEAPVVSGAPVAVPGTTVSLEPPQGFVAAEEFPGFQQEDLCAAIQVRELSWPADAAQETMTEEKLASRGMTLLSTQKVEVGGIDSLLLQVSQTADGMEFLKWMLVTGDARQTVIVIGTFPKAEEAATSEPVLKAMLSTTRDAGVKPNPWAGLPFRIAPSARLKLATRINDSLVFTQDGTFGPGSAPGDVVYLVGEADANEASTDVEALSRSLLPQAAKIKDLRNLEGRHLTVGGLGAYEMIADATYVESDETVRVCQTIALDGQGCFVFVGIVGSAHADTYLPEFRSMTASFQRVPTGQ